MKFSRMLQEAVDYGRFVQEVEVKVDRFLKDDPFAELVDKEVMPAFDKMQSIKNQLRIYENMERIPGGPQNFIETTSKVVEEIRSQIHNCETKYRIICFKKTKEANSLMADVNKVRTKIFEILDDNEMDLLEKEGIVLDLETHKLPKRPGKRFDEVIDIIESLVKVYTQLEISETELQILMEKHNVTDEYQAYQFPDILKVAEVVAEVDTELRDKISKGKKYLTLYLPYIENAFRSLLDNFEKLKDYQTDRKERYEKLAEMLDEDVPKIRERLKDLGYGRNIKTDEL